jgi:XTP/dITP diphosphohydrolase
MLHKIVIASSNAGKIREFNAIFAEKSIEIIPQTTFNVPDVEETGLTFIENAILKARHCCTHTGLPSIADDSGLIIDALDGRPGIYSARYAGKNSSNEEKIAKVLADMSEVLAPQRTARFISIIVFMRNHDDPAPIICEGIWEGSILTEPHGTNGFGYDPIFWVPEHRCAAAELNPVVKNQISHRAQALQKLFERLTM